MFSFKRHGEPETPADLARPNCLGFRPVSGAIHPREFASPEASGHGFIVEPLGSIATNEGDGDDDPREVERPASEATAALDRCAAPYSITLASRRMRR
ncbi:hypothetical protein [Burkholderia sp. LMG 21824]|uniref:hypothetical protein n=1 Tax=Burkholderia sp. LMG 21824 TaxID=3158172 RepID=UPI003C2F8AF2